MIHVALLIPTLDRLAGAERQVMLLAKGLSVRGWRVTVIALSGTGAEAQSDFNHSGVAFLTLGMRKGLADPRGWIRFRRWILRESPNIIHAHLPHAAWMARWSRLFAPIRVVIDTVHTSATGTLRRRLGYRWSEWLSDRVTAVSAGVAHSYQSARMVFPGRLVVVYNGVDVAHWRPDSSTRHVLRRRLGLIGEFLWLVVGRLDPVKDHATLLCAMLNAPGNAHLFIAGAGPLEAQLRSFTWQNGLESRVHFLGFQADLLPWMQAADALVLSSRWEGLPMSLLEAAACALPTVATDVPGSREVIVHNKTGFLVPAGDPRHLGDAMARIMSLSPHERNEMGARARVHILNPFSLDSVLDRWENLYHELLEAHPRPMRRARN
jgi:glycosyltransferase involved in cell wall biosynthesis